MFILAVILICIVISIPSFHKGSIMMPGWRHLIVGSVKSFLLFVIPWAIYVFSITFTPDAKSSCAYGWMSCLRACSTALLPVMIWSSIAIWIIEIPPRDKEIMPSCVTNGLFIGIITHILLLTFSFFQGKEFVNILLFYGYIPIWYTYRFIKEIRKKSISIISLITSIILTFPLLILNIRLSKSKYTLLPDNPSSDCFIVTAASYGHPWLVNSYICPEKHICTNKQLQRFRMFENIWKRKYPESHRMFRYVYNRIGPVIARRIRNRTLSDITYLILKPIELIAVVINSVLITCESR
ncbi:MAG: hypothetical protein GX640_11565 [Fibrobacter sp.]|nr:hypothetical protein [Fibrobacter sp.]